MLKAKIGEEKITESKDSRESKETAHCWRGCRTADTERPVFIDKELPDKTPTERATEDPSCTQEVGLLASL